MKMSKEISNRSLNVFFFFKKKSKDQLREVKARLDQIIAKSNMDVDVQIITNSELELLKITISSLGETQSWRDQKQIFNNLNQKAELYKLNPFGFSELYWGKTNNTAMINEIGSKDSKPLKTKYGNILKVKNSLEIPTNTEVASGYVLLTNSKDYKKTNDLFILPENDGFFILESNFQKAMMEVSEYLKIQQILLDNMESLDKESRTILFSLDDVREQENKINELTRKYLKFINQVSLVKQAYNTIQIDMTICQEIIDGINIGKDEFSKDYFYKIKITKKQMEMDLKYCSSALENVQTGLDLLRGTNSIALRKKGLAIQAALAIVEISFVFYYSLGVWHLLLGEETWLGIPPEVKLLVGGGLAIIIPIFAHLLVIQKINIFDHIPALIRNEKLILILCGIIILILFFFAYNYSI